MTQMAKKKNTVNYSHNIQAREQELSYVQRTSVKYIKAETVVIGNSQ